MKELKQIGSFAFKGGVGKTSLSYLLAYAMHERGETVSLVDFDPQHSLAVASDISPPPFKVVRGNINSDDLKIPSDTTLAIIDHPPGIEPEKIAGVYDLIMIPFVANPMELHPLSYALGKLKGENIVLVANRYRGLASEDNAIQSIKDAYDFPILTMGQLADIPEAIASGRNVRKSKASDNVLTLLKLISKKIGRKSKW